MAEWFALLFHIWEIRHSNFGPYTVYPSSNFSRFYSSAYRKFCVRSLKLRHAAS